MTTTAQNATPRIESLLVAAHRNLSVLQERRSALERGGIGQDHLAADEVLTAFALLGEHERDAMLAEVGAHWAALQSKGLVCGGIENATTPVLRLIAHILPHTKAIGSIWQQIRGAVDAPEPPHGTWHSATSVCGSWGQLARLHFSVQDVEHLMIDPDPVFGLQPVLVALDPDRCHTGSFPFAIDNGVITMRLRHRNGNVYRQVVQATVEEMA